MLQTLHQSIGSSATWFVGHQSKVPALLFELRFIHTNYCCIYVAHWTKQWPEKPTSTQQSITTDNRTIQAVFEELWNLQLQLMIIIVIGKCFVYEISENTILPTEIHNSQLYKSANLRGDTGCSFWLINNLKIIQLLKWFPLNCQSMD